MKSDESKTSNHDKEFLHHFSKASPCIFIAGKMSSYALSGGEGNFILSKNLLPDIRLPFESSRKTNDYRPTITLSSGEGLPRKSPSYDNLRVRLFYASTNSTAGVFPDNVSRICLSIRSIRSGLSMKICFTASRPCPSFVSS